MQAQKLQAEGPGGRMDITKKLLTIYHNFFSKNPYIFPSICIFLSFDVFLSLYSSFFLFFYVAIVLSFYFSMFLWRNLVNCLDVTTKNRGFRSKLREPRIGSRGACAVKLSIQFVGKNLHWLYTMVPQTWLSWFVDITRIYGSYLWCFYFCLWKPKRSWRAPHWFPAILALSRHSWRRIFRPPRCGLEGWRLHGNEEPQDHP